MSRRSRRSRWGSMCQNPPLPPASAFHSFHYPPMYRRGEAHGPYGAARPYGAYGAAEDYGGAEAYRASQPYRAPESYGNYRAAEPPFSMPQDNYVMPPPISFFNQQQVAPPAPRFPNIEMAATTPFPRSRFPDPERPSTSSSFNSETYNLTVQVDRNSTREVTNRRADAARLSGTAPTGAWNMPKEVEPNAERAREAAPGEEARAGATTPEDIKMEDDEEDDIIQITDQEPHSVEVKRECIKNMSIEVKNENGQIPSSMVKSEYCRCCGTPKRIIVTLNCHPKKEPDIRGTADDPIVLDDEEQEENPVEEEPDYQSMEQAVLEDDPLDEVMSLDNLIEDAILVEETPESPPPENEDVEDPVRIPLTPRSASPESLHQALRRIQEEQEQDEEREEDQEEDEEEHQERPSASPPGDPLPHGRPRVDSDDDGMLPDSDDEPYFTDSESENEQPQPSSTSSSNISQPIVPSRFARNRRPIIDMDALAYTMKRRILQMNTAISPRIIYAKVTANEALDDLMQALDMPGTKIVIAVERRTPAQEAPRRSPSPQNSREESPQNERKRSESPAKKPDNKRPRITGPFELKPTKTKCCRRSSMESEEEPMQSNDSPATPASSPPRSVSPASEARALALASLRRPIAPPSTEDIPLPPSVENNQPEEPSHQDEEVLPPPPPPPELDTHDMDNSAVVDMDVDVEEEPVQKSTPTENARRIPTIGSTSTNQVNLLTQLRSNNINISLDPPPPPPKLTEQEQLMADIREVTKRRVMTGSVHQDELSPNCIRPQQALGRTFPLKVRVVVEEEGDHSDSNNYNQENYRPKVAALRKVASESQVTDSGRNEPKFLPPWAVRRLELSAQPALPLCFGNRTMRVINGKRIYSDSNTCYEFAEKGTCTAGIFCRFGHGEQEPTERKICAKMLRGQCRGDRGCPLNHDLPPHQVPICDFYMRYSCNHASCCFLHVKHSEDKPPCEDFNKGTCSNGDACSKPHRYIYRTVKQRGEFPSFPANGVAAQQ